MIRDIAYLFSRCTQDDSGCWIWQGAIASNGYGHYNDGTKTVAVHRRSWELFNRKAVPPSKRVLHSCDVRSCINPHHLSVGTASQNSQEMVERGRKRGGGTRKLTPSETAAVAAQVNEGRPRKEIAADFGISTTTVYIIGTRRAGEVAA